ncbi:MAG TPA: hypothetical protein VMH87_05600 [Pseudomonadales bacterium]|nr:hypothetical protein [Pseudomonadales bacterium]
MNAKQNIPLFPAGPGLLIGGAVIVALAWLFSDDKKPSIPRPDIEKANSMKIVPPDPQPPFTDARRPVSREDLSAVFNNGSRTLTRQAAVSGLKQLGFGKTAAYKALSIDGRYASLLQFGPDGIISWKG